MVSTAELKAFIKEQGTIGEEQIARRFLTTAPVIAMMCERLAAKGDVRLIATGEHCCGKDQCTGCTDVMSAQRAWRWIRKD